MKILFLTDNFPPEVNAPATRTYEHCKLWVEQGDEVTVITCFPNFPSGRVFDGYKNRLRREEIMDGIRVIRVWTYMAPNQSRRKRLLDYGSFTVAAFFAGLRVKTDVIIATSPQFFTTIAGYLLSVLKRRPWVFELRDMWPESVIAVGVMKQGFLTKTALRLAKFFYRQSDLVVVVSPAFGRELEKYGVEPKKIKYVPNGVDRGTFGPRPKSGRLVEELGLQGKYVIGYMGTIGMAHGLDFVVKCLPSLSGEDFHFLFVGAGACRDEVKKLADDLGLENASFIDQVPRSDVPDYLSIFDVCLVPLRRSEVFTRVIPSKIFEAAAMEKPVLLGVDGQAREIVEGYDSGLFFEPENKEAFVSAVRRIRGLAEANGRFARGARHLAADFERTALADKMHKHLRGLEG